MYIYILGYDMVQVVCGEQYDLREVLKKTFFRLEDVDLSGGELGRR